MGDPFALKLTLSPQGSGPSYIENLENKVTTDLPIVYNKKLLNLTPQNIRTISYVYVSPGKKYIVVGVIHFYAWKVVKINHKTNATKKIL